MKENYSDSSDDILEPGFSSLRDRPIADGPSEELIVGTLAALSHAAERKWSILSRMNNMKFITRVAAGVLVVVGLGVLAAVLLRSPEVTCAEVVEKVRSAHTMSCLITTRGSHMKMIMNDQGQMCGQGDDGTRFAWDKKSGRMVMVQPAVKTVVVMDMKNLPNQPDQPADFIEQFKKLEGNSAQDLGRARMDGRSAEKFAATQDQVRYVIWADRRTQEPIRIDVTVKLLGQAATATLSNFEFDIAVPQSAFNQEIPAGYTVQRYNVNVPDINNGEENVVEALRGFALRDDGRFPSQLDDISQLIKLVKPTDHRVSDSDMQWIIRFQMVQHFLGTLARGDWKYLGSGKTTKDANALIFWYKTAKGYRAIYGDLTAKDLAAAPK